MQLERGMPGGGLGEGQFPPTPPTHPYQLLPLQRFIAISLAPLTSIYSAYAPLEEFLNETLYCNTYVCRSGYWSGSLTHTQSELGGFFVTMRLYYGSVCFLPEHQRSKASCRTNTHVLYILCNGMFLCSYKNGDLQITERLPVATPPCGQSTSCTPLASPLPSCSPPPLGSPRVRSPESDDSVSVASSASALARKATFMVPD